MGCTNSVAMQTSDLSFKSGGSTKKPKRGTFSSIATLDSLDTMADGYFLTKINKRYGNPQYFREDGYDIGLRVRVKGVFHSTFVACSRKSYDKVSIKEHHLRYYPTKESIAASGADHGSSSSVDGETVVISEVMFLAKLNHECIPKLHELFITESSLYLVTNYIDPFRMTNFLDLKEGKTMLHISDVRRIAKSLFSAVAHCHDRGVIVRDLTPQNIMVRKSGIDGNTGGSMKVEVMITDFSLAVQVGSTQTLADHPLFEWNMVPYTAPEALLGHDYSFPMDCWSLGVLIYVMIAGIEPFHHDDDHVLVENIKTASFDFEEDAFDSVDKSVKMLIIDMLRPLPEGRLTVKQALKNAWFSQLNA